MWLWTSVPHVEYSFRILSFIDVCLKVLVKNKYVKTVQDILLWQIHTKSVKNVYINVFDCFRTSLHESQTLIPRSAPILAAPWSPSLDSIWTQAHAPAPVLWSTSCRVRSSGESACTTSLVNVCWTCLWSWGWCVWLGLCSFCVSASLWVAHAGLCDLALSSLKDVNLCTVNATGLILYSYH